MSGNTKSIVFSQWRLYCISNHFEGSLRGTVSRAVASNTSGPGFESIFINNIWLLLTVDKTKINKTEAGNGPDKKVYYSSIGMPFSKLQI